MLSHILKDPGHGLTLASITLTMDKMGIGASKINVENKNRVLRSHAGKINAVGSTASITNSSNKLFNGQDIMTSIHWGEQQNFALCI